MVVLIQSQTLAFTMGKLACREQLLLLVVQTDSINCDTKMNAYYRAAIRPNNKSPLQSICKMLVYCFRNLCAMSTNQRVATAWIVSRDHQVYQPG